MTKKITALLALSLFLSVFSSACGRSKSSDEAADYSQGALTISGEMIDFPVTDESSARVSVESVGEFLGIDDADKDLGDCIEGDSLGINTYRFSREYNGIPIYGNSVVVCAGSDGEVLQISGIPLNIDGLNTVPKLDSNEIIRKVYEAEKYNEDILILNSGLTIYINENNKPVLCYKLFSLDAEWTECLVNADSGEIVHQTWVQAETVICSGEDNQGKQRDFPTEYEDGNYYLVDQERDITIYDSHGRSMQMKIVIVDDE